MIGHLLNRELTVRRRTFVDDGAGGRIPGRFEVDTIRVMVSQPTPAEVEATGQWGAQLSHVVHALPGVEVFRGDELVGDLPSEVPAGSCLRVIAIVRNSRSTYTRILCETTQAEG